MRTFAQMTGGLYFSPVFQGELPNIFSQINDSIRNKYVLTYRPTNAKNDGSYRKVKVYLVDNEGKPLKMQDEKGRLMKYSIVARDGYRQNPPSSNWKFPTLKTIAGAPGEESEKFNEAQCCTNSCLLV